ncbi:hypothetical protein B9Z55_000293 [Caenorhabditis nigoni]|uniref:Uncharacterized protein n=1 Tax=Caenorhabditis nigoni TaxID=1611254 RepID=A0A2G5VN52_9PELO|nr:hypothetical protein B9Z55_000293 [Caenorhabditis nigoni]
MLNARPNLLHNLEYNRALYINLVGASEGNERNRVRRNIYNFVTRTLNWVPAYERRYTAFMFVKNDNRGYVELENELRREINLRGLTDDVIFYVLVRPAFEMDGEE